MSYTVEVSPCKKYIIVKFIDEIKVDAAIQAGVDAHALSKENDIHRCLFDMSEARNTDTVMDNYIFAYEKIKKVKTLDPQLKVVSLVNPDDHSHDFVQTALLNAGTSGNFFTNREEEIAFLLKESNVPE